VRNIAIPHARAPLIHFLDDDDLAPEGYYAQIIPQFSKYPDTGLIFGGCCILRVHHSQVRSYVHR
jgi:hypothetical protein